MASDKLDNNYNARREYTIIVASTALQTITATKALSWV